MVATVGHGGRPHASRGWGVTVLDGDGARIRLLLDADDAALEANLRGGSRLAVNGTDVRTLDSVQTKGRVVSLEEADAVDRRRMRRHCDLFWGAVEEVDGFPREMTAHLIPRRLLACVAELDEWYDQTPGPNAGRASRTPTRARDRSAGDERSPALGPHRLLPRGRPGRGRHGLGVGQPEHRLPL